MEIISKSSQQTQDIAHKLAQQLNGGEILCFSGELGAGKTTFIQGLAKGLEIKENLTSPTFVIFKKYPAKNNLEFYHFDLYRIHDPQEILDLGYTEIINNKKNISAIEWSEKIKDQIPLKNVIHINLEYLDKDQRKIIINENNEL
ncbi:MAG: tRNA (adenosine(37)-N6)-threonylcarbamoyltransferase complex ATPase subunit type 1 TsaE [Patescibacteria group bacterium]|jgi:tRNA threonylcarbamoyladenosine biosynthesis protein TsaE